MSWRDWKRGALWPWCLIGVHRWGDPAYYLGSYTIHRTCRVCGKTRIREWKP